ncbi:collagen alpha-1(I) chain-like [Cavia porcellus]|uniref:collagen alpha-1(I) chain-like n=1 Tax=Cavia porcellus TaxID=10141 RepID=UPI002FE08B8D
MQLPESASCAPPLPQPPDFQVSGRLQILQLHSGEVGEGAGLSQLAGSPSPGRAAPQDSDLDLGPLGPRTSPKPHPKFSPSRGFAPGGPSVPGVPARSGAHGPRLLCDSCARSMPAPAPARPPSNPQLSAREPRPPRLRARASVSLQRRGEPGLPPGLSGRRRSCLGQGAPRAGRGPRFLPSSGRALPPRAPGAVRETEAGGSGRRGRGAGQGPRDAPTPQPDPPPSAARRCRPRRPGRSETRVQRAPEGRRGPPWSAPAAARCEDGVQMGAPRAPSEGKGRAEPGEGRPGAVSLQRPRGPGSREPALRGPSWPVPQPEVSRPWTGPGRSRRGQRRSPDPDTQSHPGEPGLGSCTQLGPSLWLLFPELPNLDRRTVTGLPPPSWLTSGLNRDGETEAGPVQMPLSCLEHLKDPQSRKEAEA